MRKSILSVLLLVVVSGMVLITAVPAHAHEHRKVGKWDFVAGWGDEPAYAGFKNSVQLILSDATGKPVPDLGDTLKVEVTTGTQKMSLSVAPNFEPGEFGVTGDYRAWLIPTQPGVYTFHFTGTIKGDKIDASFTSSETTFDSLKDPAEVQFPVKEPAPNVIAERIDREVPRLESTDTKLAADVAAARKKAKDATTFGYIGIGAGALGMILAMLAMVRRSR